MVLLEQNIRIRNHNYMFLVVEVVLYKSVLVLLVLVHSMQNILQTMYILRILVLSAHNFRLDRSIGMVKLELLLG
jgi:hypothetical protein